MTMSPLFYVLEIYVSVTFPGLCEGKIACRRKDDLVLRVYCRGMGNPIFVDFLVKKPSKFEYYSKEEEGGVEINSITPPTPQVR